MLGPPRPSAVAIPDGHGGPGGGDDPDDGDDGDDDLLPRQSRSIAWGQFQLAQVFKRGVLYGWGATCRCHSNGPNDRTTCKKQLAMGADTDDTLQRKLKMWLLNGAALRSRTGDGGHLYTECRDLVVHESEAELAHQRIVLFGR
jgi:hypothetical protein